MLKGRMPRRWPMMSREDSSVLELSIYSEASSSSGDEDDDLASEWSEWEDPLWIKDDNLRRPARDSPTQKARSPLTPRSATAAGSCSGLRKSSTMGGSGSSQLIVRKLSALAIAQQVVPTASTTTTTSKKSGSLSLSISLSFEGQESGTGSPVSTPSSSSASTPSSSRLSCFLATPSSPASTHLRVPMKVTELVAQDEADEAWSLGAGTLAFKSISDVDQHVDTIQEDDDHRATANNNNEGDYDDQVEADGADDGSIEEEVEAELSSDEGGTDDGGDDQKAGGEDEDDDVDDEGTKDDDVEEKGIEYLLRKYFPESLAGEQDSPPPDPTTKERKKKSKGQKKKKKKRNHKEKKEGKEEKRTKSKRLLAHGRGQAPITRTNDSADEAAPPSRLVFSVDAVVLERRDKAREKYQSLFIPALDLRRSAGDDPDNSDAERHKPSSAGGRRRVRHRSDRERRMPQSAREGFGRKSARELGMIFRCRSREDVTDDERNVIDTDAEAIASPRARRARSRTLETVEPPPSAAPSVSPRAKAKHSWIIKREDSHPRPTAQWGNENGREHLGQVYGRLSVSTSSFAVAADSSLSPPPTSFSASGVLSPRKKTGSFRSLLSGRRAAGSSAGEAQQRRDTISAEHPTLASSSSSSSSSASSWSSKSALPSTSLSSSPSATSSTSSPSPSSPSAKRRGRSSSLNKAAGLFKRSGSLRTARDNKQVVSADDNGGGGGGLAGGDSRSRSGSAGGDQQAPQKERKEKVVGGFKKSWREMKSYFASDREVKTYFNGSASMPATLES